MVQFDTTILSSLAFSDGFWLTYRKRALFASSKMREAFSSRSGLAWSKPASTIVTCCSSARHSADLRSQNSTSILPSSLSRYT